MMGHHPCWQKAGKEPALVILVHVKAVKHGEAENAAGPESIQTSSLFGHSIVLKIQSKNFNKILKIFKNIKFLLQNWVHHCAW